MEEKKISDAEKTIQQNYINAAILHGKASLVGDYETANKQYKTLAKIYKHWVNDPLLAKTIVGSLLADDNPSVKIWTATHALQLNIFINEAKETLKRCSINPDIGILRLNAEMVLREWDKKENHPE